MVYLKVRSMCLIIIFGSYDRLSTIKPYISLAMKAEVKLRCDFSTPSKQQVCSVTIEHCQWVFHLPLKACTRHGQSSFTHFTSYVLLLHFTTLNSFLRDNDHSFIASLTASTVGYFDPCTTSFSLYPHSGHLPSCTIGLPKLCSLHSTGTWSPSSSDESLPCCICSASSSSLCICSTIMGILSPSSACPCGSVSVTCTSSFCCSSSSPSACSSICALGVPSFGSAAAATCGFS